MKKEIRIPWNKVEEAKKEMGTKRQGEPWQYIHKGTAGGRGVYGAVLDSLRDTRVGGVKGKAKDQLSQHWYPYFNLSFLFNTVVACLSACVVCLVSGCGEEGGNRGVLS